MSDAPLRGQASVGAGWSASLFPTAFECGGSFATSRTREGRPRADGPTEDPEASRASAARRARTSTRRYATANRTSRLATLTLKEACHDPLLLRGYVADFFRELRGGLGGKPFPYIWTAEQHKKLDAAGNTHGLHVHFVVGQYVPRRLIDQAWGRGFVHIRALTDQGLGRDSAADKINASRRAAGYLSKYISKAFEDERVPGLHRYEVAQGFQPPRERLMGRTVAEVLARASERMGAKPQVVWTSAQATDWQGPPALWASWSG